jgi:hypothetical protein
MVQRRDSVDPDPVAPSYRFWMEDFADKLDDGDLAYSEDGGCIMYADEIDLDSRQACQRRGGEAGRPRRRTGPAT